MAKAKVKTSRARSLNPAPINPLAAAVLVTAASAKFTGYEPIFEGVELTPENRQHHLMTGFNWYNYNFGAKDSTAFLVEYLTVNDRKPEAKAIKRTPDYTIPNAFGWMARMTMMGYVLDETETARLEAAMKKAIAAVPVKIVADTTDTTAKDTKVKFNIQERMREKCSDVGGVIEGMIDDFIKAGALSKHDFKPIEALKIANILPAHVGGEVQHFEAMRNELKEVQGGKDADLVEGYNQLNKIQIRNIVKFLDLIIADYNSYVAFKKATKAPRKRKIKTPAQLVYKLKYNKDDKDLKLVSDNPTKIIGAKEMFVYNVKKRKLMYFIADEHAGNELSVKNNTITGFDTVKSTQKTIRKPKEQLKELMSASKPNSRKVFKNTKSVETKLSGRFSEDIIILKVF